MAAKLTTGTATNEDVTALLQGEALKNQARHFLPARLHLVFEYTGSENSIEALQSRAFTATGTKKVKHKQ